MPKARTTINSITPSNPSFGEQITIDVTTDISNPVIDVRAYQGGTMVYRELSMLKRGDNVATLGPTPSWQGGAAEGDIRVGSAGTRLVFPRNPEFTFHIDE